MSAIEPTEAIMATLWILLLCETFLGMVYLIICEDEVKQREVGE
jgi:hypothetical protein